MLRPLLINTWDSGGGAAIATYRIHQGLRRIGVDSTMLVQTKGTADSSVIGPERSLDKFVALARPRLEALLLKQYPRTKAIFSPAAIPDSIDDKVAAIDPDIVHLFWIASAFLKIETIGRFRKPIVWTLHDMWPFTGGCHYDGECGRYTGSCGECPVLGSSSPHDLSRRVWERKRSSWSNANITVVATSRWLADCARASSLFRRNRIEVLPNGLDLEVHKPLDKNASRAAYGLPLDKKLILFSAGSATTDPRKGYQFLLPALRQMAAEGWGDRAELVVVGASEPQDGADLGMKAHFVGRLKDDVSQVLLYSAADVLVAPSVQENLANTVVEALACGAPAVAFNIGGMPDMIRHKENGFLAEPFSHQALAEGISWVLDDSARHDVLSANARSDALAKYEATAVARQYEALYRDIVG